MASDTIDFTNLAYAATDKVTTTTSGANTKVTVTAGTTKSMFTLAGSWYVLRLRPRVRRCDGHVPDAYLSNAMLWLHGVEMDFSRSGKPTDNAFAESLNGKVSGRKVF